MPFMSKVKLAVLISGGGTNLQAIIDAIAQKKINAEIVCVGSNKPDAYGLERAKKAGIATFFLNYKEAKESFQQEDAWLSYFNEREQATNLSPNNSPFRRMNQEELTSRIIAEKLLLEKLAQFKVDFLVCAGFMKLLTPFFMEQFQPDPLKPRIINIHPALLPAFPGTDGYGDAYSYGTKVHGATVHFVDYGVDSGPIIDQSCYRRLSNESEDSFKSRGLELEWELYVKCLKLLCEKRLKIFRNSSKRIIVEEMPKRKFNPH
jgi:phosphoribosylglycinamide formyltransferase-1